LDIKQAGDNLTRLPRPVADFNIEQNLKHIVERVGAVEAGFSYSVDQSLTSTHAQVTVSVTDPNNALVSVEFRTMTPGSTSWSSYATDSAPYVATVAREAGRMSAIGWRITWVNASGDTIVEEDARMFSNTVAAVDPTSGQLDEGVETSGGGGVFVKPGVAYPNDLDGVPDSSGRVAVTPNQQTGAQNAYDGLDSGGYVKSGKVLADAIAALLGGGNAVTNSSFEDSTLSEFGTYNNYPANVTVTLSSTAAQARFGSRSMQIVVASFGGTPNATTNGGFGFYTGSYTFRAGCSYVLSWWVMAPAGVQVHMANTNLTNATFTTLLNPTPNGTWQRYAVRITKTVADQVENVFLSFSEPSGDGNFTVYVDAMQLEDGEVLTAYAPKPDELLPGAVTTTAIADDAVTTPKLIAGAVTAGKISVAFLSAISAFLGTVYTGLIQNTATNPTAAIRLDSGTTLPGTATSYIDMPATGSNPFIKTPSLQINADGGIWIDDTEVPQVGTVGSPSTLTKQLRIPAAAFRLDDESSGGGGFGEDGAAVEAEGPVNLAVGNGRGTAFFPVPQGATITAIRYRYKMREFGSPPSPLNNHVKVHFIKYSDANAPTTLYTATQQSPINDTWTTVSSALSEAVATDTTYKVFFELRAIYDSANSLTSDVALQWVELEYQIPDYATSI
jgi:hypothetical protein